MPKKTLKDFSGGLNTRLSKSHISETEAQDSVDIDLSGNRIQPAKGIDESIIASGDYKFRSKWITDEEAVSFSEYGDSIIKSYENKKPQFQSLKEEGGVSDSIDLGVPPTPAPPTPVLQTTGTATTADNAYAYHTVYTETIKNSGGIASGAGGGNPQTLLPGTVEGQHIHVDSTGGFSFFKEPSSSATTYTPNYSESGTLVRYSSGYSLTFSISITHWNSSENEFRRPSYFFKGDYFVGVSDSGISKKLLTDSTASETTHAFTSPTIQEYVGDSCTADAQDGIEQAYTTVHRTTVSSDSDEIFVSRVHRGHGGSISGTGSVISGTKNGVWRTNAGCVHIEGEPNLSNSNIKKVTLREGTWYVVLWFDPGWVRKKEWIQTHPLGLGVKDWISLAPDWRGNNSIGGYGWEYVSSSAFEASSGGRTAMGWFSDFTESVHDIYETGSQTFWNWANPSQSENASPGATSPTVVSYTIDPLALWSCHNQADQWEVPTTLDGTHFYSELDDSGVGSFVGSAHDGTGPTDTTNTGIFFGNDCSSISQISGSEYVGASEKGFAPYYNNQAQIKGGALYIPWDTTASVNVGPFPTYIFEVATSNKLARSSLRGMSARVFSQKKGSGSDERTEYFFRRNDRLDGGVYNLKEESAAGRSGDLTVSPDWEPPSGSPEVYDYGLGVSIQKFLTIYHDYHSEERRGKGLRYRWHQLEQAPLYNGGSYKNPTQQTPQYILGDKDYALNTIHMKNLSIDSTINALSYPVAQNKCAVINTVHKLAFTETGATTIHCTEGVPDYKIQDRSTTTVSVENVNETLHVSSYNWACTPLQQINSAKMAKVSGSLKRASLPADRERQAAMHPQFGLASSPTSKAESLGTEYVPESYLRGSSEYDLASSRHINPDSSASLVTSGWLPFKAKTTYQVPTNSPVSDQGVIFQRSDNYGTPSSSYIPEYKIGLANTEGSDLSSQPQIEATEDHRFYANDNGVLIRGGPFMNDGSFHPGAIRSHPLSASFSIANTTTITISAFNDYEVKSDVVLFYNPGIEIIDPSDMNDSSKHLSLGDLNFRAQIHKAFITGSVSTGKLFLSVKGKPEELVVVNLESETNERALYRVPVSHFLSLITNDKYVIGSVYTAGTKLFSNLTRCWIVYPSELESGTIPITSTNHTSGTSSGTVKKIFSKNDDTDSKFILISTSGNQEWSSPNLSLELSNDRDLTLVAEPDKYSIKVQSNISGQNITNMPQEAMRNIYIGDIVTSTSINGNSTVPSNTEVITKSGTTIQVTTSCTLNVEDTLTFTRYVKESDVWFSTDDFGNIETPIDYTSDYDFAATYTGPSEILSFAGSANDYIPISRIGGIEGTTTSGNYAYDSNSKYYFRVFLDKNLISSTGTSLGEVEFSKGIPNMFSSITNLPIQYRISLLRNIGTAINPSYIESGASQESSQISLSTSTNFITLRDLPVGLSSDIQKIRIYRTGGLYAAYGWLKDVDISKGVEGVDDQSRFIGSTALTPLSITTPPPFIEGRKNLKYVSYVSGLFYAGYGSTLRVSEYGNPHSWPEQAYYPLDGDITGIRQYQGEGVVWTANSAYRLRGASYDDITIVKIPDQQGMPEGNFSSLIEALNSLFWISNDGVCMYSQGRISLISQEKFKVFPKLVNSKGAAKDNVLHFFTETGYGMACDLRSNRPKFSKISENTDRRAFYSQTDDRLFLSRSLNSGAYGDGSFKSLKFTSGTIDFGDSNEYKVYHRSQIRYKGSGSIEFKFQEGSDISEISETFNLPFVTEETSKYLEFSLAKTAFHVVFTVLGEIEVLEVSFESEPASSYSQKMRFESADVIYRGSPMLNITVDGVIAPITPDLVSSELLTTIRVYLPPSTEGYIPHYTNIGGGEIISVTHNKSEI